MTITDSTLTAQLSHTELPLGGTTGTRSLLETRLERRVRPPMLLLWLCSPSSPMQKGGRSSRLTELMHLPIFSDAQARLGWLFLVTWINLEAAGLGMLLDTVQIQLAERPVPLLCVLQFPPRGPESEFSANYNI